jgi:hypothetical protein
VSNVLLLGEEEKLMRKLKIANIWITAFLLAVGMTGCGDPDTSKGGPPPSLTPPTVISVVPAGGVTGVCQGAVVTATFSKAMNPGTIIQSPETTFTLSAGATAVPGTVSLDSTDTIATFTPTNLLLVNTQYTATITTAAQDQFGNGLAADFTWMFKTAVNGCPAPIAIAPELCGIGILAGSAITNSSGASVVNGDVDISPGSAIAGFPPGIINGTRHTTDATAAAAQNRLTTAFTTAMTLPPGTLLVGNIGGETLPPGVYTRTTASGAGGDSLGITGNLTLDPVGDPNATWIFQIGSTLTTAGGNVTVLSPGKPGNVFWEIGSAATLGVNTTMAGNLMAQAAITMNGGNTLNGRALARTAGAVTISTTTINVPPCGP